MNPQIDFNRFKQSLESCKPFKDELESERKLFHDIVFNWNTVADIDLSKVSEEILEKLICQVDAFWNYERIYAEQFERILSATKKAPRCQYGTKRLI